MVASDFAAVDSRYESSIEPLRTHPLTPQTGLAMALSSITVVTSSLLLKRYTPPKVCAREAALPVPHDSAYRDTPLEISGSSSDEDDEQVALLL